MAKLVKIKTLREFFRSGSVGGFILIASVLISIAIANSSWGILFEDLLKTEIGMNLSFANLRYPVLSWINDGLMAVFFLLVGLEIKRELIEGELSSIKKAMLPILAATGGVLAPAAIYFAFNAGTSTEKGWGIPMATDIAFAIAIISMLGHKVPASLRVFLAALAIVDDLIAILVIAVFYSSDMHFIYLGYATGVFLLLLVLNKSGVRNLAAYLIPGCFMWYFIHHSGVHATIAGVLTAFAIPARESSAASPLVKLEHMLLKPVNFLIMPIFALANTNIEFEAGMVDGLTTTFGFGIIAGLVIGKPLGITLISWVAVKLGFANVPNQAGWKHILGVGMLGGIGFTMSVFIALLSFSGEHMLLSTAKFAILCGSVTSGLMGYLWLSRLDNVNRDQEA